MIKSDIDNLSEYYRYELTYLRSAGEDFAIRFPKIARRLDLSHEESADPHVERLIESFAFLTGKLQKQIDDLYPEMANAMLDVIYKPLVLPTPSAVMINFDVDLSKAQKNPGMIVPRQTTLTAIDTNGVVISFRTSHDLKLWPIQLKNAEIVSNEESPLLQSETRTFIKLTFYNLAEGVVPPSLRFYITSDALQRGKIFAGIFSSELPAVLHQNDSFEILSQITPIGLEDDEALFAYPDNVHKGFRYLQEYFSFPEKFYGFDVPLGKNLSKDFSIYLPLGTNIKTISHTHFSMSAVPAVNLFPKVSEPLRLDFKQLEYLLVPDARRYSSHEIYDIKKIVAVDPDTNEEINIPEFYSCDHFSSKSDLNVFWLSKRKNSCKKDAMGDDIYVSFVDEGFNPSNSDNKVFYAYTLCTNRHLAEDVPARGILQTELSLPVKQIYCINRPTAQTNSLKNGELLWKIISALSLNSISFFDHGMKKFKEVLRLFADVTNSNLDDEINAITGIECHHAIRRTVQQSWYGFINGTEICLNFDNQLHNCGLPLSLIVSKFLATYTTINTFSEVSVKTQNGLVKKWAKQTGIKNYL